MVLPGKRKGEVDGADVLVTIPVSHPLAEFTCLVTSLEWRTIDTYHHCEVPKTGEAKKLIIFYVVGDMDRHKKCSDEVGPRKTMYRKVGTLQSQGDLLGSRARFPLV